MFNRNKDLYKNNICDDPQENHNSSSTVEEYDSDYYEDEDIDSDEDGADYDDDDDDDDDDDEMDYNSEEDIDDSENPTKYRKVIYSILCTLISCVLIFGISLKVTEYYLAKIKVDDLRNSYPYTVNGSNIMDTDLASYVPEEYTESIDTIIESYAVDVKLKENNITYDNEDIPSYIVNSEQYQSMTYKEQLKTNNSYILTSKKNELLDRFLENYRSAPSTKTITTYYLKAIETSSGNTVDISCSTENLDKKIADDLDVLSTGASIYNTIINGVRYSTVTLSDKQVKFIYSDASIIEAQKNMELELTNIKAKFIVAEAENKQE